MNSGRRVQAEDKDVLGYTKEVSIVSIVEHVRYLRMLANT